MSETRKIPAPTDPSIDVAGLVPAQRKTEVERRPWPADPRYLAGDDGSIVGPSGRKLAFYRNPKDPRPTIRASTNGWTRTVRVHVLIAEAWHGLRLAGQEVAHGNGDEQDNRPSNLRWATHLENEADKVGHGTRLQGERIRQSKLTDETVRMIRDEYRAGNVAHSDLARRHGVSPAAIGLALQGETWGHIEGATRERHPTINRGERHGGARLTDQAVREIRKALAGGATVSGLARRYGVARMAIQGVKYHRTWRHVT